jgi:hypothetical protein
MCTFIGSEGATPLAFQLREADAENIAGDLVVRHPVPSHRVNMAAVVLVLHFGNEFPCEVVFHRNRL